jgi:cytochrome c553
MKNRLIVVTCVAVVVSILGVSTTSAMTKFNKAFEAKYVKDSDSDDLKAAYKTAKCYTCHIKGEKSKEVRNAYGDALAELIPGDVKARLKAASDAGATKEESKELKSAEEDKILKELEEAFDKAEEIASPTGDTFGERIKAGKLPQDIVVKEKDE